MAESLGVDRARSAAFGLLPARSRGLTDRTRGVSPFGKVGDYSCSFWSGGRARKHPMCTSAPSVECDYFNISYQTSCRSIELYNAYLYRWMRIKMRNLITGGSRPFRLDSRGPAPSVGDVAPARGGP